MELPSESVDTQQRHQEKVQQHFHVLAVDDSMIDRKLLERLLQKVFSCRVTCVDSGDKALKYLGLLDGIESTSSVSSPLPSKHEGMKVNLIMTDYCMPAMTGYDLLKRLKGSSWKDVPVVVMSSETFPSRISMCMEEGAKEFLLKPLQLSDLKKLQPYMSKSTYYSSEEQGSNCLIPATDHCEHSKIVHEDDNSNETNKKDGIAV